VEIRREGSRMKPSETKLRKWLESRLVAPPLVVSVRLYHAMETEEGTREMLVTKRPVRDLDGRAVELAASLAAELHEAAEEHAEAFRETELPQLFNLAVFSKTEEGKLRRGDCCALRLRDEGVRSNYRGPAGRPFGSTEPPTLRGERAQSMRHLEGSQRSLQEATARIIDSYGRLLDRVMEDNERLSGGFSTTIKLAAEMQDTKHQRDMEVARFVAEEDRKGAVAKQVIDTVIPEFAKRAIPKWFGDEPKKHALVKGETSSSSSSTDERAELRRLVEALPSSVSASVVDALALPDRLALYQMQAGAGALSDSERKRLARAVYGLPAGPSELFVSALGKDGCERLVTMIGRPPEDLREDPPPPAAEVAT